MTAPLSPRAAELLVYIQTRELCPTNREMQALLGMGAGKTTALLDELEAKGFIRRLRDRARAIEVLRPLPGLKVIFGPDHFERRAADVRRLSYTVCHTCGERRIEPCTFAGCPKREAA